MFFPYESILSTKISDEISRKILVGQGSIMTVEVIFELGGIGTLHHHIHEQVTYILEGEFLFTIGEQKYTCKKGDSLYIPPSIIHGCKCLKKGRVLDIFTPQREDFYS